MATLPTTLGDMPTPNPQRRVRGYDSQTLPNAQIKNAQDMEIAAKERQSKVDKDAILDAQDRENQAKRKVLDLLYGTDDTPGIYSAKGADAINSSDKFMEKWQTIREQTMNGVSNPVAQRALQKQLDDMGLQNIGNLKKFEMDERRGYASNLATAKEDNARERVGLEWNNDQTMAESMAEAESAARARAKIAGYAEGDEAWQETIRGAKSKVVTTRLSAMLNQSDPAVISEAYRKYEKSRDAGELSFDDVNKLDTAFDQALPRAKAYEDLGKFKGKKMTGEPAQVFKGIIQVESGGKQFDDNGLAVTSPKGAIGIAQIMPATGPEAAKLAGVAWDENKFRTDAGYNQSLGEAYYNSLQAKYKDPALAALAYNWGMGNVDKHLEKSGDPRKGEVSMDYFLTTVPSKEARQYVPKVMAAAGMGGTNGPIDMDMAKNYASSIQDPKEREEFVKLAEQENKAFAAQKEADIKSTLDAAVSAMVEGGAWDAVPNSLRAKAQELGMLEDLTSYDPSKPSDPAVVASLMKLNAKELTETELNTPSIRLSLSPGDYQAWNQRKTRMSEPAVAFTDTLRKTMVQEALDSRGLMPFYKTSAKKNALLIQVNNFVDLGVDAYAKTHNGNYPDGVAMQKIVDDVFLKGQYEIEKNWWPDPEEDYKFQVQAAEIPKHEREIILNDLARDGSPQTDAAVVQRYLQAKDIQKRRIGDIPQSDRVKLAALLTKAGRPVTEDALRDYWIKFGRN